MMFTGNQASELIDNTTNEWTSLNGVNGMKFYNNTDFSKYIFLPAAGRWQDTNHYFVNTDGFSWSVSRTVGDDPSPILIVCDNGSLYTGTIDGSVGCSIRPVANPKPW